MKKGARGSFFLRELCDRLSGPLSGDRGEVVGGDLALTILGRALLAVGILLQREDFSQYIGVAALAARVQDLSAPHDKPHALFSAEETTNCEHHGSPDFADDMNGEPLCGESLSIDV